MQFFNGKNKFLTIFSFLCVWISYTSNQLTMWMEDFFSSFLFSVHFNYPLYAWILRKKFICEKNVKI